jgi:large subunit ribosomal protein L17
MRHQKHGRKFGRKSGPRHALFASLVDALLTHEHIRTTDAKAKEIRRIAEKAITWATSVGKLVANEKNDAEDKARVVHAMRMAGRIVKQKVTLQKLFNEIGPRFVGRPGGYTRVLKLGNRHGDAAPMSIIELVERGEKNVEAAPAEATEKKAKAPKAEASAKAPKAPKAKKADAAEGDAPKAKKATKKKSEE